MTHIEESSKKKDVDVLLKRSLEITVGDFLGVEPEELEKYDIKNLLKAVTSIQNGVSRRSKISLDLVLRNAANEGTKEYIKEIRSFDNRMRDKSLSQIEWIEFNYLNPANNFIRRIRDYLKDGWYVYGNNPLVSILSTSDTPFFDNERQKELEGILPSVYENVSTVLINLLTYDWDGQDITTVWCREVAKSYLKIDDETYEKLFSFDVDFSYDEWLKRLTSTMAKLKEVETILTGVRDRLFDNDYVTGVFNKLMCAGVRDAENIVLGIVEESLSER